MTLFYLTKKRCQPRSWHRSNDGPGTASGSVTYLAQSKALIDRGHYDPNLDRKSLACRQLRFSTRARQLGYAHAPDAAWVAQQEALRRSERTKAGLKVA